MDRDFESFSTNFSSWLKKQKIRAGKNIIYADAISETLAIAKWDCRQVGKPTLFLFLFLNGLWLICLLSLSL